MSIQQSFVQVFFPPSPFPFHVSEFRLPAAFFLSLVWTALFHTSSQFDFDTSGVTVTSFSRLLRVGNRRVSASRVLKTDTLYSGVSGLVITVD